MIGFATPWIFGVALIASLGITVLHFLSVRQPRVMMLPTARFVPERDARAVARQAKPSDVPLLLLRVVALLAAGAALAGARCGGQGARVSSIVVIDRALRADSTALLSRTMRNASAGTPGDAVPPTVLWVHGVSDDPGVAIAAAIRETAHQAQANPSLAELSLTVVLPETVRSRRGWDAWRSAWPAGIRLVSTDDVDASDTLATSPMSSGTVRVVRSGEAVRAVAVADVVEAAFALRGRIAAGGPSTAATEVVVYRANTDSVSDAVSSAAVTVRWPIDGVPAGWSAAPRLDSVGAVTAGGMALVAPWVRTALPPVLSDSVRAIAWWSDGVPAAVERMNGTSCVREVAMTVAEGGDLLLSPAADGLLRGLQAPCGGIGVPAPREPAARTSLVSVRRFRDLGIATRTTKPMWLATALLTLAFMALLAEQVVRRDSTGAESS